MDAAAFLNSVRQVIEDLRAEYEATGRRADFDELVRRYQAEGRWPFDD